MTLNKRTDQPFCQTALLKYISGKSAQNLIWNGYTTINFHWDLRKGFLQDIKITELNDTIFEKERHIIELQEMCREQEELVQAKAKAFHIIQQKLLVFLKFFMR